MAACELSEWDLQAFRICLIKANYCTNLLHCVDTHCAHKICIRSGQ